MKFLRINESRDPLLRAISMVMPDRWIDEQWPARRYPGVTRWKRWRTSQLVRLHLLALLKRSGSFNETRRETLHNADFRRFCRLGKSDGVPTAGTLSKFRAGLGHGLWQALHAFLIRKLVALLGIPEVGLFVVDATDLPAAVRRTWKKNRTLRSSNA